MRKTLAHKRCIGATSACQYLRYFFKIRDTEVTLSSLTHLTKFDKQHACRGDGAMGVGGHTLEVACVSSVQVADAEA